MQNLNFKTSSEFNAAFAAFQSSTLSKELSEKFRVKPFFEQYATLRKLVFISTYFIHLFAITTSFIGVYVFIFTMVKNQLIAIFLTAVFLILLEMLKRVTVPKAIKEFLQFRQYRVFLIVSSVVLSTLSVGLSYYGASDTVKLLTPDAVVTNVEPTKQEYKERIRELNRQRKEIKKSMSWRGTLTPQGAKAYNAVTAQIGRLEGDMIDNINRITATNDQTTKQHNEATNIKGSYFAIFTLFFDLLLLVAFFFLEYYDYRSFTEFANHSQDENEQNASSYDNTVVATENEQNISSYDNNTVATDLEPTSTPVATDKNAFSLNASTVQLAIKKAKANIAAYNAKISKGEGNPESNRVGIERWENNLKELEQMLC